ncbi:MAG: hypothetical protein HZB52_04580 [Chloroflexi bacterium]|nr:hypothetical protein [Chloroflexota bacterium]
MQNFTPPEDFWSRQHNAQRFSFCFESLDAQVKIISNDKSVLGAAELSARRYSQTSVRPRHIEIDIVVTQTNTAPVPADLNISYSGVEEWITFSVGGWGYGFGNLKTKIAHAFLSPALAKDVRWVSRFVIDHYVLNFLLTEWAMVHSSCVVNTKGTLIAMVAPHNVGKSTTAFKLLRSGNKFLADGMILLKEADGGLAVGGYPVGEVKLRDDVIGLFPEYRGARESGKTVIDLRTVHADHLVTDVFTPKSICLCLVERGARTNLTRIKNQEAAPTLAANTVFWDHESNLKNNSRILNRLLQVARCYRLVLGDDDQIFSVMETL